MFKHSGMFNRIIFNSLLISFIPVLTILSVFCYYVYITDKREIQSNAKDILKQYVQSVQNEIETTFSESDYILRSSDISENLSVDFESNSQRLVFSNYLSEYIDTFALRDDNNTVFKIYTSNDTLYEGRYISNISRLSAAGKISEQLKNDNTNQAWDTSVNDDGIGNKYLRFYRKIITDKFSILEGKVYIPQAPENSEIYILPGSAELDNDNIFIKEQINGCFYARLKPDYSMAGGEVIKTVAFFVFFFFFSLLLVLFLVRKITGRFTMNIDSFIKTLAQNRVFDIKDNVCLQEDDPEEIKIIKNAILSLLAEINKISDSKREIELEKRDMELNLLQKQIDPHTLYNSLSAIKCNAFLRNDTETINIVDHMTWYYRAVLNRGKEFVTIKEELEMLKRYVAINELSRDLKYNLKIDMDSGLYECEIIHLLLQPFIENAILHGFDGEQKNCKITITGRCEPDRLHIIVTDNGFGMGAEKLEQINDMENYSLSYGIKNSYRRLKLVYGENSSIRYESRPGFGTKVTISFPYRF